jgi:hypothetical protein
MDLKKKPGLPRPYLKNNQQNQLAVLETSILTSLGLSFSKHKLEVILFLKPRETPSKSSSFTCFQLLAFS